MKNVIVVLCLFLNFSLFAQNTAGVIEYKEVFVVADSVKENLKDLPEDIFKAITSEKKTYNILYFNENEVLYRNLKKEDTTASEYKDPDAFSFGMNQARPDYFHHVDLKTGTITESLEFFGRRFFVTQEHPNQKKWKITTEIKLIAGYPCQKASCETAEGLIYAWFTPKIPVQVGPKDLYGLPGAVLQVEYKRVNRVITADEIELIKPEADHLEIPVKGKKVTYEEFQKIKEEKTQEMKEQFKNGNFMMGHD